MKDLRDSRKVVGSTDCKSQWANKELGFGYKGNDL